MSYQPKFKASERPRITESRHAYNILFHNWDQGRIELNEQFCILLLNRSNNMIGMTEISSGGFAGTLIDLKLVFGIALKRCASAIILCHNHPTGNLKPSGSDLILTMRLVEAGKLLDLAILDHIYYPGGITYHLKMKGFLALF